MNYKGYEINIQKDDDANSPRQDDNLGTMAIFGRNAFLGDEHRGSAFIAIESVLEHVLTSGAVFLPLKIREGYIVSLSFDVADMVKIRLGYSAGYFENTSDFENLISDNTNGVIYMDIEKVIKEFGDDSPDSRERALGALKSEVETYNQYLAGEIYGYVITKPCEDSECDGSKEIDSCWGFYGEECCETEAKAVIDSLIESAAKKKRTATKNSTKGVSHVAV